MENSTRSAMISVVGRPNAGKSTLTNALAGEKVAIVSGKPQTTRNRIRAIIDRGNIQLVLIDTPGFHKARTKLGDYMVRVVTESVADVDAIVLMVEPVPSAGPQELALIEKVRRAKCASVLVINKIDTVPKERLLAVIAEYDKQHGFDAILPVSAKNRDGTEELMQVLEKFAKPGPKLFPEGMVTDQPERQICAEIVREKLLCCLEKEIPHGTAVVVTRFSEREDTEIIDWDVTIYCEKASHKGIIIGKNGEMLKKIGALARADIEKFMGTRVFLQTWVKVRENWRDNDRLLRNFGYRE